MKGYNRLPRLTTDGELGQRHIAVEQHTALDYPQHWHNYFEIEIVVEGTGTHVFNGESHPVGKGDAYLLTPIDFHEIKSNTPIQLINVSFDETRLSERMKNLLYSSLLTKKRHFDKEDYQHLLWATQLLHRECITEAPCVNQLLEYLLSRFLPWDAPALGDHDLRHVNGINKAVAYIEVHFRERITLQRLSQLSGYHPSYFSELFRKITGQTYIEKLTQLRIRYAKALLSEGLSVSEACYESGFGSLSNFSSAFKAQCHTSPGQYRKNRQKH